MQNRRSLPKKKKKRLNSHRQQPTKGCCRALAPAHHHNKHPSETTAKTLWTSVPKIEWSALQKGVFAGISTTVIIEIQVILITAVKLPSKWTNMFSYIEGVL